MAPHSFARYDLIIFDFHKTLTNSVYFDTFDPETRNLISDLIFRPPNNVRWEKAWMAGRLHYEDVIDHLSEHTDLSHAELDGGLREGLGQIRWNRSVWEFSQSVRKVTKTAIATINSDVFSRFIMPLYDLSRKFDVVKNSYELRRDDKTALCRAAAGELGLSLGTHRILLIDDKPRNIDDFAAAGGEGVLYQTDALFEEWLKEGQYYS